MFWNHMDIGGSKDRAHIWSYQNDRKKALIEAKKTHGYGSIPIDTFLVG